jgi:Gas vesicle protein G
MGLLKQVLLLPLAPVRGTVWVAGKIADTAEEQLRGPDAVRARLAALNQALESGEIDTEEFEREEERLLDLLEGAARPATDTDGTRTDGTRTYGTRGAHP